MACLPWPTICKASSLPRHCSVVKSLARVWVKSALSSLSAQHRLAEYHTLFWQQLFAQDDYQKAEIVLGYSSLPLEVPSQWGLSRVLDDGKQLFLPVIRQGTMSFGPIRSQEELSPYGSSIIQQLPKLASPMPTPPLHLNTVLVAPCLATTNDGFRLGYGAGYYDRYLANNPYLITYLFCLENLRMDIFKAQKHDQSFHFTITEKDIYKHCDKHSV